VTVDAHGDVAKIFQVYRGVLCHYSDYFRALLNGGWKDSASDISLDDVSPELFSVSSTGVEHVVNRVVYYATGTEIYISAG
jgi:hypothetical protein